MRPILWGHTLDLDSTVRVYAAEVISRMYVAESRQREPDQRVKRRLKPGHLLFEIL